MTHAGGRYAIGMPLFSVPRILQWPVALTKAQKVRVILNFCYSDDFLSKYWDDAFEWHMQTFKSIHMSSIIAHFFAVSTHYVTYAQLQKIRDAGFPTMLMAGTDDKVCFSFHHHHHHLSALSPLKPAFSPAHFTKMCTQLVRVANSKELHNYLNCKLEVMEGAGHMINLECPDRYP